MAAIDVVQSPENRSDKKEHLNSCAENDIIKLFENELKEYPQVYQFIQKLQEMVERQRRLLQKYSEKFKQLKKEVQHAAVQTDTNDILEKSMPTDDKGGIDINSFKEEIVQAAHSAVQKSGFVYEPVSGLYYDYNTGYYYNSELGLYYDGNTSSYYSFNEQDNKFEFHSQVQATNNDGSQAQSRQSATNNDRPQAPSRQNAPNNDGLQAPYRQNAPNSEGPQAPSRQNAPNNDGLQAPYRQNAPNNDGLQAPYRQNAPNSEGPQVPSRQHAIHNDRSARTKKTQDFDGVSLKSSSKDVIVHSQSAQSSVTPLPDTETDILSDVSSNSDICDNFEPAIVEMETSESKEKTKQADSEVTSHCVRDDLSAQFTRLNILDIATVRSRALEIANAWPPCLRIIVTDTSVKGLPVGTLFLVTCLGGTVGREGEHAVLIPDINISKHHAKIAFTGSETNKEDPSKGYTLVDLGSRNGTYANGIRLSAALQESEPHLLKHGTELRIASTKLSVHIHQGRDTCDQCEPGVLMPDKNKATSAKLDLTSSSSQNRQLELKRLRKKFGLDKTLAKPKVNSSYEDRAEKRRQTVGSLVEGEKTQVAHIEEKISNENKGFRMLSKMGWKTGQTLGKDEANKEALTEPIIPQQYAKNAGLGSSVPLPARSNSKEERKKTVWEKTQARYNVLGDEPPPSTFPDEEQ